MEKRRGRLLERSMSFLALPDNPPSSASTEIHNGFEIRCLCQISTIVQVKRETESVETFYSVDNVFRGWMARKRSCSFEFCALGAETKPRSLPLCRGSGSSCFSSAHSKVTKRELRGPLSLAFLLYYAQFSAQFILHVIYVHCLVQFCSRSWAIRAV